MPPLGRILELPRPLGSACEVESCAKIWRANGQKTLVLEGTDANKDNQEQALHRNARESHQERKPRDSTLTLGSIRRWLSNRLSNAQN
jgi:hypothetical protein